jgi:fatty acid desaturase
MTQKDIIATCPKCQSSKIKKNIKWWNIIATFAVLLFLGGGLGLLPKHLWAFAIIFGSWFGLTLFLRKNVCQACGHKWR